MPTEAEILNDWHRSLVILHRAHWEAASHYEDRNLKLSIATTLLSAIAGTAVFATIAESENVLLRVAAGAFSMIAAAVSAIQGFMRSSEVADRHKAAGTKFGQLRRELEQLQLIGLPAAAADKDALLKDFRARWDEAESNVPPAPAAIFKQVSGKVAFYESAGAKGAKSPP